MTDQVEDAPSGTAQFFRLSIKCKKALHEQGSTTLGVVAAPGLLCVFLGHGNLTHTLFNSQTVLSRGTFDVLWKNVQSTG